MAASSNDRTVRLRDGRALGFAEFGDPQGTPLFFFHGAGSGRLTRHPDDSIVTSQGIRLITVDRPGIGVSDLSPGRRLLDWPNDVAQLADALGIGRFAVLGWSAGGPHALACAYALPERIHAAGVLSGLAPLRGPCAAPTASLVRWRMRCLFDGLPETVRRPGVSIGDRTYRFLSSIQDPFASVANAADPQSAVPHEVRPVNEQGLLDLIRSRQWHRMIEIAMLFRPWGFLLEDIASRVYLWHGAGDRTIPVTMAHHLRSVIPRTELTVWPYEGHRAGFAHWQEVVQSVTR